MQARECVSGSREWVFEDLAQWLRQPVPVQRPPHTSSHGTGSSTAAPAAPAVPIERRIWWLQGGAAAGKTVCCSVLLERFRPQVLAAHFCKASLPESLDHHSFCHSLCAQMAASLGPGFRRACLASLVQKRRELVRQILPFPQAQYWNARLDGDPQASVAELVQVTAPHGPISSSSHSSPHVLVLILTKDRPPTPPTTTTRPSPHSYQ